MRLVLGVGEHSCKGIVHEVGSQNVRRYHLHCTLRQCRRIIGEQTKKGAKVDALKDVVVFRANGRQYLTLMIHIVS